MPLPAINGWEVKTEEEVVDNVLSAAYLELPYDARAALEVLRELMYLVWSIPNLVFHDLFEEHEVDHEEPVV